MHRVSKTRANTCSVLLSSARGHHLRKMQKTSLFSVRESVKGAAKISNIVEIDFIFWAEEKGRYVTLSS